jgi:hypothetical protein
MAKHLALAIALTGLLSAPALAQSPAPAPDCAVLISQVRDQVANRFDSGSHLAIDLAAQAERLLGDQKPADCLAKIQEAAQVAGLIVK